MTTSATPTPERLAWLTIRKQRGEECTYKSGDLVIDLVAVPTRPDATQIDAADNLVLGSKELQFLIDPAELVDENGAQVEPELNDEITIKRFNQAYRCAPNGSSDDVWRWSDPRRTWRRINAAEK